MSAEVLTRLKTRGPLATKTHTMVDGVIETAPYTNAAMFNAELFEVSGIYDVAGLLAEVLEPDPHSFLIRGVPKPDAGLEGVRRKKADNGGVFEPSPGHCWLPIDLDDLPSPKTDAVELNDSGDVIGIRDPSAYVRAVITEHLPDYFHDVTTYYAFSSSAGVKGWDQVRLRLHFWLAEPLTDSVLHDVWARHHVKVTDPAIYRDVQPIYTAAPKFVGMSDPCDGWRSGLIRGARDVVTIPSEHLTEPLEVREQRLEAQALLERRQQSLKTLSGSEWDKLQARAWSWLKGALEGVSRDIASLPDGRYRALCKQAIRLAGYADGLRALGGDSSRYLAELEAIMLGAADASGATAKHGQSKIQSAIAGAIANGADNPLPIPIDLEESPAGTARETEEDTQARIARVVNAKAQLDPKLFDRVINVNERYLSNAWRDIRKQIPDGPAIVFVQSHIGTAKSTSVFGDFEIADSKDVKIVTPLVELCSSISQKAETENYKNFEIEDYKSYYERDNKRVTITPNSDPKFSYSAFYSGKIEQPIYQHKHAIYDEFDATVARLSDSDVENEQSMFNAMVSTIGGALLKRGKVYALSAYHQQGELTLVNHVRSRLKAEHGLDVPLILVRNQHKPATECSYTLLTPEVTQTEDGKKISKQKALRAAVIKKMIERYAAGANVALASDSDTFAQEVLEAFEKEFGDDFKQNPKRRPLLIDSTHKNEDAQRAFLDNPNRDARDHPAIFYTPVLQVGFDVPKDKHDHEVFAYMSARSVNPMQATQLVGRLRGLTHMTLAVENYSDNRSHNPENVKKELKQSLEADSRLLKTELDGSRVWANDTFAQVHAENIAHDRWLRSSWRQHFLALLDGQGWERTEDEVVSIGALEGDGYDFVKEVVKEHEASEIADAPEITQTEADKLRRDPNLTKSDRYKLEAHEYASFYGVKPDKQRLLDDNRKRLRSVVKRLAIARADDTTLHYERDKDLKSAFYSDGIATQRSADKLKRVALQRMFYKLILEAAQVDLHDLSSRAEYSREDEGVQKLVRMLKKHRHVFGNLASIPDNETLDDSALPFLTVNLRLLGLKTEESNRTDERKSLADEYYSEIISPLEDGARLEPTHPNRKRTKYKLTVGETITTVDTKRVNHLLKSEVLKRGSDDVIRLDRERLAGTFLRPGETRDRTRYYRARIDTDANPGLLERLEEREAVVAASVQKWSADDSAVSEFDDVSLRGPRQDFLYKKDVGAGHGADIVLDAKKEHVSLHGPRSDSELRSATKCPDTLASSQPEALPPATDSAPESHLITAFETLLEKRPPTLKESSLVAIRTWVDARDTESLERCWRGFERYRPDLIDMLGLRAQA